MEKLLKLRDEMKEDLLHGSIFPFWEQYTIVLFKRLLNRFVYGN